MSIATLPDDFCEFLQCLNGRNVRYMIVEGHAVSFHGYPRFTHDVDIVVIPEVDNARALLGALHDFGFGSVSLTAEDFTRPVTVALGRAPYQIDIMTYIKGVDIGQAWQRRVQGLLDGVLVTLISRVDLIANKRAVGRPEDLADVADLSAALRMVRLTSRTATPKAATRRGVLRDHPPRSGAYFLSRSIP